MSDQPVPERPGDEVDPQMDQRFQDRLGCILRRPRSTAGSFPYVVREWVACAEWLTGCTGPHSQTAKMLRAAGDQMAREVGRVDSLPPISEREAKRQIHGEMGETPIYGMLLHLAVADPRQADQIRPLASQILLAYATLIYHDGGQRIALCTEHRTGKPPVPSAPEACRLVRQLAVGKHPEILAHLPRKQAHLSYAFAHLEAVLPEGIDEPRYVSQASAIRVMIRDAKNRSSRRNRRSSQRRAPNPTPPTEKPDAEDAGETELQEHQRRQQAVEGTQVLSIGPLSRDQSHEYQRIGFAPTEVRPERVTMRSSIMRGEHPGDSLSMRVRRQQGMVRDRARGNQRLPIHRDLPRRDEVRTLLTDLRPWMQGTATASNAIDAEAVGLLVLILATGGTAEDLHGLPVLKDESAIPDDQCRAILTRCGVHLWVRVPAPEMDPALYSEVSDLLQPTETGLLLTLPKPILTLLQCVRRAAGTTQTSSMFASDFDDLKQAATTRLKKINERRHSRLRLTRLPAVLPQVIADQCSNWSYAWILSGDGDPHAHTPLVYQTTAKSHLVAAYRVAIEHIFGPSFDREADHSPAPPDECYYGSALRPLAGVLEGFALELRQGIPETPSALAGIEEHVSHHNAYALYTAMMALIGTGLRAVRDPIESTLDIDWDSGLLYVVDKEARASGNERTIPLPPTVLQQLEVYRRHLLALGSRWSQRQPQVAAQLRAAASSDESTPFLVFLSEEMPPSITSIRPATLSPRLADLFPAPVNFGRHHIRTYLTEMGCPGEWIDALLGHEPIGLEAYGAHSALAIEDLRDMVSEWIEPMLQRHGWKVLEGVAR
ncbi:site-specific integrase [Thioalkalivibrio sp. AKL12]|uniref:site-specific integrase n=1 Tax=Thioalkalivibrio sp. AKL12 TaxID=1158159 RepID=UPI00039EDCD1|nr:site-specific integrase [Thioalkalivibrio sp. AKL12]